MGEHSNGPRRHVLVAMTLLAALTIGTRAVAPWRLEVINDEVHHHLESWRNRYRTDNIYPMFLEQMEGKLSPRQMAVVRRIYFAHPLFQRSAIILVDPQPPLFPVLAETIEAATHSSLTALRLPSAIGSVLGVWLIYLVGWRLRDRATGLWMAALLAISHLTQVFAGLGRPYALAQTGVIAVIYGFLRDQEKTDRSPALLLLTALVAQSLQWMAWAVVGPLVVAALLGRLARGVSPARLLRQTWWYLLLSLLLLSEMAVQLRNPTISGQAGLQSAGTIWRHFTVVAPFAELGSFGPRWLDIGGIAFLLAVAGGLAIVVLRPQHLAIGRVALLATLALCIVTPIVVGFHQRFMLTYLLMPMIFAGIGFRALINSERAACIAISLVAVIFGTARAAHPLDPYAYALVDDMPFSQAAAVLKQELREGDRWAGYQYYRSNCLYRYGPLPEPPMLRNVEGIKTAVTQTPPGKSFYLFMQTPLVLPEGVAPAATWDLFGGRYVIAKLSPPAPAATRP